MKVCARCHIEKDKDHFRAVKNGDGLYSYCKDCDKEKQTEYRRKRGINPKGRRPIDLLPESKVCNRCHVEKHQNEFRIRQDKRDGFSYLNNECRECDKERAAVYYAKRKDDPNFKRKNAERSRQYIKSNSDQIRQRRTTEQYKKKHAVGNMNSYYRVKDRVAARMRVKRQTPEYKSMMKSYREKNKSKIHEQEKITKRRYHEKHRDALTDEYIINQLKSQGVADENILEKCPQLIEAKRIQILIKREIKNHGTDH